MKFTCLILFLFFTTLSNAQSFNSSTLELKEIMKGNEFIGFQPENPRWTTSGKAILFEWNPENNLGYSTYIYYLDSKKYEKVTSEILKNNLEWDVIQQEHSSVYYILDNTLIQFDLKTKIFNKIYQTNNPIQNIQRIPNSESVFVTIKSNLFEYNPVLKSFIQLTNFMTEEDNFQKTDSTYLEKQQVELFQYIRDKNKKNKWNQDNDLTLFSLPKEIYFGKEELDNIQISSQKNFIFYRLGNFPKEENTQIEAYITSNGQAKSINARPNVTQSEPNFKLAIIDLTRDTNYLVDFSTLSNIRMKPTYLNQKSLYGKDRNLIMHRVICSKDEKFTIVDIRSCDNKDRWIVSIDLKSGRITEIDNQHDEAWIGGPGIHEWDTEAGVLGFLNDNKTIYFQSEKTGYSHLYTYDLTTKITQTLTDGNWEVYNATLSKNGTQFFITANKTHPGNRDFYHLVLKDKKLIPILTNNGNHEVFVSPDESHLVVRYSFSNKPWELFTCPNVEKAKLKQITISTTENFNKYAWKNPEVIKIKGSDGIEFYARLFLPTKEKKNNATIMFVHGAGYLQNAHNYWSYYCREYMFHNLLIDNGYTVIDIDYRASEGYGRDYRTAIANDMGGRDLEDYIDAKKYLVKQYGLDSNRFGIYGGSYGGFITLMGMLKTAGEFKCGAALRSVTDWAHYNNEYTSNILNYPETNPEAYKRSSPIYYANNLKGRLLMLHGMIDDNVQFSDVVRLSQRFIELGKTNWELAVFPVEAHGFKESYSWADEFRRIYELFEEELK